MYQDWRNVHQDWRNVRCMDTGCGITALCREKSQARHVRGYDYGGMGTSCLADENYDGHADVGGAGAEYRLTRVWGRRCRQNGSGGWLTDVVDWCG